MEKIRIRANQQAWVHYNEERRSLIEGKIKQLSESIRMQLASAPSVSVTLGTPFFEGATISRSEALTGPIGAIGTPASQIAEENLRRATVVLTPILESIRERSDDQLSPEDLSYIGYQAALAMEGSSLEIEVPDTKSVSLQSIGETRQIATDAQELQRIRKDTEVAAARRIAVETEMIGAQHEIDANFGDVAALTLKRDQLLQSYKADFIAETSDRGAEQKIVGEINYIIVP